MLPTNSLHANLHRCRRGCRQLFHRRALQHPPTSTNHHLRYTNNKNVRRMISAVLPPTLSRSQTFETSALSGTYQHGKIIHANNLNDAVKGRRDYHDHEDQPEPEYLELVTHTADRMRSAVRDYVAEYSHQCGDGENASKNPCSQNATTIMASTSSQNPPIKLVGILATTTTHPISNDNNNFDDESDTSSSCYYDNDTHGNERYSEQIATSCSSDGIVYEPWRVPPTIEALERAIQHANERLDVHGILVFYPVFDKLLLNDENNNNADNSKGGGRTYKCQATGVYYRSMDDYFRDLVACHKDVEGYCRKGLRIQEKPDISSSKDDQMGDDEKSQHIVKAEELGPIYPCTALAVFKILESFHALSNNNEQSDVGDAKNIESNKHLFCNVTMTIINRSEVLGLPLATMLSNQGATVYSVDIDSILKFLPDGKVRREHATTTMEECLRKSSVIVSGVPSNSFKIPTEWIPEGATVINVATESNFDEETIDDARGVTYVPHVGRVTVAALQYNLMCLHRNYHLE